MESRNKHVLVQVRCPHCTNDDATLVERTPYGTLFCNVCAGEWIPSRARLTDDDDDGNSSR